MKVKLCKNIASETLETYKEKLEIFEYGEPVELFHFIKELTKTLEAMVSTYASAHIQFPHIIICVKG